MAEKNDVKQSLSERAHYKIKIRLEYIKTRARGVARASNDKKIAVMAAAVATLISEAQQYGSGSLYAHYLHLSSEMFQCINRRLQMDKTSAMCARLATSLQTISKVSEVLESAQIGDTPIDDVTYSIADSLNAKARRQQHEDNLDGASHSSVMRENARRIVFLLDFVG